MERIWEFFKKESVLCISALCALGTMLLVPPDGAYWGYIDLRVLCLLACLMLVVEAAKSCGVFEWLSALLLRRCGSGRSLGVVLMALPFFSSMLVTNDVALLTFVPFTLMLLRRIGCEKAIVPVLVVQTVAANLGSMATPVGNPQNLYLYAAYELSATEFFSLTLPLTALSLVLLAVLSAYMLPKELPPFSLEKAELRGGKKLALYAVLFCICLLTVLRMLHFGVMTLIVLLALAFVEPKLLKKADIALLLTFVCFFIVSGNLGRVDAVREFLQQLLSRSTLFTSAAASQVISNVPAAVLLAEFTNDWRALLAGVNVGGLGTPIASLASLITLKIYLRERDAAAGKFLAVFTAANVLGLAVLLAASVLLV